MKQYAILDLPRRPRTLAKPPGGLPVPRRYMLLRAWVVEETKHPHLVPLEWIRQPRGLVW